MRTRAVDMDTTALRPLGWYFNCGSSGNSLPSLAFAFAVRGQLILQLLSSHGASTMHKYAALRASC